MIEYECPKCGARLESPSSMAGQDDQCPACQHVSLVPVPRRNPKRRKVLGLVGSAVVILATTLVIVIFVVFNSENPSSHREGFSAQAPTSDTATHPALARLLKSGGENPATGRYGQSQTTRGSAPQSQPTSSPKGPNLPPEQLFESASPAVVCIVVRDKNFKPIGLASGFFVDANGVIVTNHHVLEGAEFATARLTSGATILVDGVLAADPNSDLAVLKASGTGFAFLKIPDVGLPEVGSPVYAIGNPRGLENTFSGGMVSGLRALKEGLTVIQVTTPISPGSSGGPLLNAGGEVVGVTTAYLPGGQNLNFAVPGAAVRRIIQAAGTIQSVASAGGGGSELDANDEIKKAWAALRKEDWRTSSEILTTLAKSHPENPYVWSAFGFLHSKLGNNEYAVQHFKRAISLKPDITDAYIYMGISYSALDQHLLCVQAFGGAIKLEPNNLRAYCGLVKGYAKLAKDADSLQRRDERTEALTKAIEAGKKALELKGVDAETYYWLGYSYNRASGDWRDRYPAAVQAYKEALRLEPGGWFASDAKTKAESLQHTIDFSGR